MANLLNLSTPAGLVLGMVAGCDFHVGPRGLVLATGYGLRTPDATAFTLGNVVLSPHGREHFLERPALLEHEERHATQYAWCLGLPLLPLYVAASAWSYARSGDFAAHNVFERRAGLAAGGYVVVSAGEPRRERATGT